jgi:Imelysin
MSTSGARMTMAVLSSALLALGTGACGGEGDHADKPAATPRAASGEDLGAIKSYLLEHSDALAASTAQLADQGSRYQKLVESAASDYTALLRSKRSEVRSAIEEMQATYIKANPQYEEMEGVVAGVPELSEFDVIIDAGSDASDPESAVPFDVELPDGKVLKQPGNFFFLTETSLFGTNPDFQARGVKADTDGDGKVAFGESVPNADMLRAFTRDFAAQAKALDKAANAWTPERADALQALVTMTPTMSEYFGQWKNSRFIAGGKADEQAFAAASRLQDIEDILGGLVLIYDNVKPAVAKADAAQAEQTGRGLEALHAFAVDLHKKEQGGTKFTAEQADTLGGEAQGRAEAIAGQVSQAAAQLGIKLES